MYLCILIVFVSIHDRVERNRSSSSTSFSETAV